MIAGCGQPVVRLLVGGEWKRVNPVAGGELFGLWGLILGIPAAALVRVLFTYFALPWIRAQQDDPEAHETEVIVETPEMVITVQNGT